MKFSDYVRLGKISIKSRKKSTRNTVRGISFGLIILVPIVFFTLAFYLGITSVVDASKRNACFEFTVAEAGMRYDKNYIDEQVLDKSVLEKLEKDYGRQAEETIGYRDFTLRNGKRSAVLDGAEKHSWGDGDGVLGNYIRVAEFFEDDGKLIPDGIVKDLHAQNKELFAAGGTFSGDGRGQVILDESTVRFFEMTPAQAVGKTFTLRAKVEFGRYYYLDDDFNPDNEYVPSEDTGDYVPSISVDVIRNFEVVGVLSGDYEKITEKSGNIFLSGAALFAEDGTMPYFPEIRRAEYVFDDIDRTCYIVTYSEEMGALEEKAAENKMFFPAYPAMEYSLSQLYKAPLLCVNLQCENYASAVTVSRFLNAEYRNISADKEKNYVEDYATFEFNRLYILGNVGMYVMIFMYTFGGVIFFATLLNLYNSVNYSVQSRRNYIGMMRAIGAKQNMIPKLYFVEILLIFLRSAVWVLLFGGGLSLGIKFGVDALFIKGEAVFGAAIKLNFGYFFLALFIAICLVFAVAYLFSRIACRSVTKKGVLEVLSEEK